MHGERRCPAHVLHPAQCTRRPGASPFDAVRVRRKAWKRGSMAWSRNRGKLDCIYASEDWTWCKADRNRLFGE